MPVLSGRNTLFPSSKIIFISLNPLKTFERMGAGQVSLERRRKNQVLWGVFSEVGPRAQGERYYDGAGYSWMHRRETRRCRWGRRKVTFEREVLWISLETSEDGRETRDVASEDMGHHQWYLVVRNWNRSETDLLGPSDQPPSHHQDSAGQLRLPPLHDVPLTGLSLHTAKGVASKSNQDMSSSWNPLWYLPTALLKNYLSPGLQPFITWLPSYPMPLCLHLPFLTMLSLRSLFCLSNIQASSHLRAFAPAIPLPGLYFLLFLAQWGSFLSFRSQLKSFS